ncbi:hypothetical protein ACI48J_03650 [Paenibacillus chitinolyticus]|uniref:hypothetical protein n=1 Tax=Paenibacillus chitinolyticus TaxID=79263 RepID=UPI0038638FD7
MNFESFKVEYLVVFDTKDLICTNLASFNHLLQANDTLKIEGDKLTYKGFTINYLVQTETFNEQQQRYFHLKLSTTEVNRVTDFEELLKSIRIILSRVCKSPVQTLWDDMSFYYAVQAYPIVHVTENLMRKLITKFMLTNVGFGWTKIYTPTQVKDSVKKKGKENLENSPEYLYETDFIQLANFLFVEYQTGNTSNLIDKIKSVSKIEELSLEELKSYAPKSNWERYFSTIVDCEHDYLKNRWESLYELRNKIAHNNRINKQEFSRIAQLVDEINVKLQSAIDNLDKIKISTQDKEELTENIIINTHQLYGQFIIEFNRLHNVLVEHFHEKDLKRLGPMQAIRLLYNKGLVDKETYEKTELVITTRNKLIHKSHEFNESELSTMIKYINEVTKVINNPFQEDEEDEYDPDLCIDCKHNKGIYPFSNDGQLCESCSSKSSKYELCTPCGTFHLWGELIDNKCVNCNKDE